MNDALKRVDAPIARRNRILKWLNEHGEATVRQIAEGIGVSKSTVQNYLNTMYRAEEVAKREHWKRSLFLVHYTALVAETKCTVHVPEPEPEPQPWRYVHKPTMPIPNQRAQGSLRRTVSVASSAGII